MVDAAGGIEVVLDPCLSTRHASGFAVFTRVCRRCSEQEQREAFGIIPSNAVPTPAPKPADPHPAPWRWEDDNGGNEVLLDANGAPLIFEGFHVSSLGTVETAGPDVRALTEAAPTLLALLQRAVKSLGEYREVIVDTEDREASMVLSEARALLERLRKAGA